MKSAIKNEVKILVLGDCNVGKTSLLRRFCTNKFEEKHTPSTLGLDIEEKSIQIDGQEVNLVIWDSAGYERNSNILPYASFNRVQGVLLVYSVDDRKSFERIQYWMSQVDEKVSKNVVKILVASKIDSENVQVPQEEGVKLAERYEIIFAETSSKNGTGVDGPFTMVAEEIVEQRKNESTVALSSERMDHLELEDLRALLRMHERPQRCCCISF